MNYLFNAKNGLIFSLKYQHLKLFVNLNITRYWLNSGQLHIMLSFQISSANTILIINPKVGDKVKSSHTDGIMNEYRVNLEKTLKEQKTSDGADGSPICTWSFYKEKDNDPLYQLGYRIKLIHQKVFRFSCRKWMK